MSTQHEKTKKILKIIGIIFLIIGIPSMIAGFVSFFISMNSMEPPKFFFLAFIGIPCTAIGASLTVFSHHREIAKYVKNEAMPVVKETYKDLRPELKDVVKTFKDEESEMNDVVLCERCGTYNDIGDKYCKKCGRELTQSKHVCPHCGATIDSDSKFCPKCGKKL